MNENKMDLERYITPFIFLQLDMYVQQYVRSTLRLDPSMVERACISTPVVCVCSIRRPVCSCFIWNFESFFMHYCAALLHCLSQSEMHTAMHSFMRCILHVLATQPWVSLSFSSPWHKYSNYSLTPSAPETSPKMETLAHITEYFLLNENSELY